MIEILEIEANQVWQLRHKIMWPNRPLEFVILPNDDEGIHYGLYEDKKLVSVVSLFVKNDEGKFRKFATEISFQKKGYGSMLLEHLINEAKHLNIKRLTCSARVDAVKFYQKFGMEMCSDVILKNGKEFVKMELVLC